MMEHLVCLRLREVLKHLSDKGAPKQSGGANFFPFVFRFLTYLLSCILFLFALRYFVNYAPLLRAVCKFRYSLLSRPFFASLRVY